LVPPRLLWFVMKVAVVPAPVCTAPSQAKVPFAFGGGGGGPGGGGDWVVSWSAPRESVLGPPPMSPAYWVYLFMATTVLFKPSRDQFNAELRRPGSQAQADKWQKLHYQGTDLEGRTIASDHRTRLRVKPFPR
jgi:hypothetical protein